MPTIDDWRWLVLEILEANTALSWEEAFGWVDEEDTTALETAIVELRDEGRIRISLSDGGYLLAEEPPPTGGY